MSGPYCPDCGAQCDPGVASCPECKFPMEIEMVSHGKGLQIEGGQMERWKRVSQILKRGGLRIKTKADPAQGMMWWLLPISGLVIFLSTLLFGHKIVDKIWEPPVAGQVLNLPGLNQGQEGAEQAELDVNEDSMDSLREAFKTSREQRELTSRTNLDLSTFVDRVEVDIDQIRANMEQAFLSVRVDNTRWRGTLVSEKGHLLVDSKLVEGAFRRDIRTINEDRNIREKAVWIVPVAERPGGEPSNTQSVIESDQIGLTLLISNIKQELSFKVEYNHNVNVGDRVWVAKEVDDTLYPEPVDVIDSVSLNEEVSVWILDANMGATYSGSPVFDKYGALTGVLIVHNDEIAMVPTITLRERAPLIYKALK